MDGERLPPRLEHELDQHLAGCARCRAFEAGARRIREGVRLRLAEAVPDLVDPIMERVGADTTGRGRPRPFRPPDRPRRPWRRRWGRTAGSSQDRRRELGRVGAALLAGALAGSAVTGTGIWPGGSPSPAA